VSRGTALLGLSPGSDVSDVAVRPSQTPAEFLALALGEFEEAVDELIVSATSGVVPAVLDRASQEAVSVDAHPPLAVGAVSQFGRPPVVARSFDTRDSIVSRRDFGEASRVHGCSNSVSPDAHLAPPRVLNGVHGRAPQ
jgi:hypothetical protein